MPGGGIEVESKFVAGPDTEAELAALGAALAGSASFRDRYYDTPALQLTLADHWLRLRQGAGWELKCPPVPPAGGAGASGPVPEPPAGGAGASGPVPEPPAGGAGASGPVPEPPAGGAGASGPVPEPPTGGAGASSSVPAAAATTYEEVTSPGAIVGRLCGVLGVAPAPGWDQVPAAVAGLGLQEFASFVTERRSYRLGALRVDLDVADFGYAVAEVEAVVTAQEAVPAALEAVMRLRQELGRGSAPRVPGKMSVYLQRRRPAHYQALLQAGVLAAAPPSSAPATAPETTQVGPRPLEKQWGTAPQRPGEMERTQCPAPQPLGEMEPPQGPTPQPLGGMEPPQGPAP